MKHPTRRRRFPRIWRCADCGSLVREGVLETKGCLARHSVCGLYQGRAARYTHMPRSTRKCPASGDEVDRHHMLTRDELWDLPEAEKARLYIEMRRDEDQLHERATASRPPCKA